ncbi:MAG: STAS domain-containing protein [Anaerolineae bacterium]|nr:STAS domain-containing protein [Phycisphaerae bacterium]
MSDLQITSEEVDGTLVLRLAGEPDMMSGEPLEDLVNSTVAAKPSKVVLDLSGLEYISSLVAGKMVALQTFLKRNGGRAVIAGPPPMVKTALERMRVVTVIPIFDTMEQALAS